MLRLLQRQSEKRGLRMIVWLEAHEMAQHPLTQLRERFLSACGFSLKRKPRMAQIADGRAKEDHQGACRLGIDSAQLDDQGQQNKTDAEGEQVRHTEAAEFQNGAFAFGGRLEGDDFWKMVENPRKAIALLFHNHQDL
jgi:hypothetical protein